MTSPTDSTIDATEADRLAATLYDARVTGVPIAPLTDAAPGLTLADAYAVQQGVVRRLLADGDRGVGYKLGLTSAPMQQLLGVDSPDFAPVLAGHVRADAADVPADSFIAPKLEAEIALVLHEDLAGPDCTAVDAARATAGAVAALELVDSRIEGWRIRLPDTVADLASSGAVVLSGRIVPLTEIDLRLVGMVFTRDGEIVATGAGAAALGDPCHAVAWLANTLHPLGEVLRAGQFVMTGALHAAVDVAAGQTYRADFDRLGPVTVRIV